MIFVRGARQLVTLRGPAPRRGTRLADLGVIPDGSLLIEGDKIHSVGTTRRLENLSAARDARPIDASGKVVLPGFVDCHTRLVSAASQPRRFGSPAAAGSDEDDADRSASVRAFRSMSASLLKSWAGKWTRQFAAHATTTIEARSSQGLYQASEVKALRVAGALDADPLDVVSTFSAARPHAAELRRSPPLAAEYVISVLLPLIRRRGLAACCNVVLGEEGFEPEHCRAILDAARGMGFLVKVSGDGASPPGAARLAAETGAVSADHLERIDDADIDRLADSETIATLLPGVVYHRGGERFAPARELIDRGAAVALASGFGAAGGSTLSMPVVLSLACGSMNMLPAEAVSAATINGAAAVGRGGLIGSLEPGKQADLAIFDVGDYREIIHYFGVNLCLMTIKRGKVVYRAPGAAELGG